MQRDKFTIVYAITLKYWTYNGEKYVIFIKLFMKGVMGNNCFKMYNFIIKVGNVQMAYSMLGSEWVIVV